MNRSFAVAILTLIWGVIGCTETEQPLSFRSVSVSSELQTALAYPVFLEDPQTAVTYRQAGLEARQQGDFAAAISTLKTAVALAPRAVSGYVLLGWTQHLAAQRNEAIGTLRQALEHDSEHVPALNALGIAYLVNGDLEPAIATHTQAKTLQADNEIAYYNLSLAYQRLPDIPAAVDHAARATELEPYNPHPWVALALAHWSHQDAAAAQSAYQEALRLDARYFDANHLEHLARAGFSSDQIQRVDEIRTQF
ncbi:MAG: tetratricopeptide repeat protein [Leptolyngbya sp. SIO1E4]|nr:tetratricopeptide repeat protein [Leptolyngbya sp. SIO1E4]